MHTPANFEVYQIARDMCPHHIRRKVIELAETKYKSLCPLIAVLQAMQEYGFDVEMDQ